ncbi:MAG: hypothetical protein WB810_02925 [Candidatus Cybelea sp.]
MAVQLRERFPHRRESTEHFDAQPMIRRGIHGDVIMTFPNGERSVSLKIDATPTPTETDEDVDAK